MNITKTTKLISIGSDSKTIKGEKLNYRTGIMYLSPNETVCPWATKGCKQGCLNTAGRGAFSATQKARSTRLGMFYSWLLDEDLWCFMGRLKNEIFNLIKTSKKKDMTPCVRLNGTSDIAWENISDILEVFPETQFYDYTKGFWRALFNFRKNYHLTFSATEFTKTYHFWLMKLFGKNTAVVFRSGLPKRYKGIRVIDGDENDLRFLDPRGVIIGLKAKGKAKQDVTGFVKD